MVEFDTIDGLRHWRVAGGIVRRADRAVLLVENERRNGDRDWSTPGGVVDAGETFHEALVREVEEETGVRIPVWAGPVYRVEVIAPDLGFHLDVEAFAASSELEPVVGDDPDGIVIAAGFHPLDDADVLLRSAPRFVREPLVTHLVDDVEDGRTFCFRIDGRGASAAVRRLDDRPAPDGANGSQ